MRYHGIISIICAAALLGISCDSRSQPVPATPDAVPDAEADAPELPKKLQPPPGAPGPFLVRIDEHLPSQLFAAAATDTHFAVAMQSDIRDITECPETNLPICFRGSAVITPRTNPNTPVRITLYESDTQSGARVDDIAAAGSRFAFAVRSGLYVGDKLEAAVLIAEPSGKISQRIALSAPQNDIRRISLSPIDDTRILMCCAQQTSGITVGHDITCETLDLRTGKRAPVASVTASAPIRTLDVASSFGKYLAVWNAGGHNYCAFLDKPKEIADLGTATAIQPAVTAGLDQFVVAWQGDDAAFRIDAVDPKLPMLKQKSQALILNGVKNRTINGIAPVADGYVFAFRHNNTQQIAIVADDLKSWDLIENSQKWRMFSGYGALDIQDAHTGKLIWQTAQSLIAAK